MKHIYLKDKIFFAILSMSFLSKMYCCRLPDTEIGVLTLQINLISGIQHMSSFEGQCNDLIGPHGCMNLT